MARKKLTVGLVGFGRFGRLAARHLKGEFNLAVFEKAKPKDFGRKISGCQVVILAVPISSFKESLREIRPHLRKGTLVVDVCSVKKYPADLMKRILPQNVELLASHPLFGPHSGSGKTLKGFKVALWPLRIEKKRYQKIKKWLAKKGLVVFEISPEKHDRMIAESQALAHFLGRILQRMKISASPLDTLSFKKALELKDYVLSDSFQLFYDIQKYNPYAKKARGRFKRALQSLEKML